jgi:lipoprotein NlpI
MNCINWRALAVLAIALAMRNSAAAADACYDLPDGDARINACTREIRANGTSDEVLADYYVNRGGAYYSRDDFDRAIADYSEAIKHNPKSSSAFRNRGNARFQKGEFDQAISDHDEAIWIDPTVANAYLNRGNAYRMKGDSASAIIDYDDAQLLETREPDIYFGRGLAYLSIGSVAKSAEDFRQDVKLNPKYAYGVIWLDLAERRNHEPSHLAQNLSQIDKKAWPTPVIRFLLGELTAEQTIAAAADKNPQTQKGQICEAHLYIGEYALLKGSKDEAIRLFRLAASECPHPFVEWAAANAELKQLQ